MQSMQDEYLWLTRTGRSGPGSHATGTLSPQDRERRLLLALARQRRERRLRRLRALRAHVGTAVNAAVGTAVRTARSDER
jgi:hypothetical protein